MVAQTQNPIKMKTQMNFSYTEKENMVDARTVPTTKETPSYLMDKRFVDYILANVSQVSLEEIKAAACRMIRDANNVKEMASSLDEFFYMHKITAMLKPEEVVETAAVNVMTSNQFRTKTTSDSVADAINRSNRHPNPETVPADVSDPTDRYNAED
jgi:predicted enzyme involved in methoxymalonyl-ACP biosynthesis